MSYSSNEKRSALREFVRSDMLSGNQKSRSLEMVPAVIVREPDALFSIISLSVRRLLKSVVFLNNTLAELTSLADALAKTKQNLLDDSALVSLGSRASALSSRLLSATKIPKQQSLRLSTSLSDSVEYLSSNLKSSVSYESQEQARRDVARKLRDLEESMTSLFVVTNNVINALSNFNISGLKDSVAVARLKRIVAALSDVAESYASMTDRQRSLAARDFVLRLLAADVVLQQALEDSVVGLARLTQQPSGAPNYRIKAVGEGTAPSLIGAVSAPWPLAAGSDSLTFADLNGGTFAVNLTGGTGIQAAEVLGSNTGPFYISGDIVTPPPLQSTLGNFNIVLNTSDQLFINVDGKIFNILLTAGAARTPTQVMNDINNDAAVVADPRVVASVVGTRVQLNYSNPSPPADYSARILEVTTGNQDASALRPWQNALGTLGTKSVGWTANNKLRIQPNDSPNYVEVTLPSGVWPNYSVVIGNVATPGTIAAAIDTAATAAGENFSADATGSKLRVFSTQEGEGSIITIRTAGANTVSGRGAAMLGLAANQEGRESDYPSYRVVNALEANTTFVTGATVSVDNVILLKGLFDVASATSVTFVDPVAVDPTYLMTTPQPKIAVSLPEGYGVYGISNYSWIANTLTIVLDRRIRDTVGTRGEATVYRRLMTISSRDNTATGTLQCSGIPTTTLGLATTLQRATLGSLQLLYNDPVLGWRSKSLFGLHIRAGDKLLEYSGDEITTITSVDSDYAQLDVSPEVNSNFVRDTMGFVIQSASLLEYITLKNALEDWFEQDAPQNLLEEVIKRFQRLYFVNTRDAALQVKSSVTALKTSLSTLETALNGYSPQDVSVVAVAMQGLRETGQDKARQALLDSDFTSYASIGGLSTGMESLRHSANAVYSKDLGIEEWSRQNVVRTIWVDAIDVNNFFPDLEAEDDGLYPPDSWGDEEI